VHVDPWPFDIKRIDLTIPSKRVLGKRFGSVEEFQEIYRTAKTESLTVAIAT
jgi:hypothetical protein